MQSPFYFIVKPIGGRYANTKNVGGVEMIVSTSLEDHLYSNRQAEVIEVPRGYTGEVVKGDTLLVHHNVFKFYNDINGKQRSGRSFLKDDTFFVDMEQFFAYKHEGIWKATDRYCFVAPIPVEDSIIKKNCTEEPLTGIMRYPSKKLMYYGVQSGDKVCFRPNCSYEFTVEGEKMYRMYEHQITMKL